MQKPLVYLDHNASAPLLPEAAEAVRGAMALSGNASSVHAGGRAVRAAIEAARAAVARAAGAAARDVVFTASATEALTQAIFGGARAFPVDAIVVGAGEHPAVRRAAEATALPLLTIGLDGNGALRLDDVAAVLARLDDQGETGLFALQLVNNETGVVQPFAEIERLIGPTRHLLVADAVQAFGKAPLDFASRPTDMMAVSGHKIGGPAGAGALLMKPHCDGVRLIPGGGQELGRRGGTEALLPVVGFGAASTGFPDAYGPERMQGLLARLEDGLLRLAPEATIFGRNVERIGNVCCFAVPGLGASVALMALDLAGIAVSTGSACSSGKVGKSHVLSAMGVDAQMMTSALRVSLGWSSSEGDIDAFLSAFAGVLAKRRTVSKGEAA